MGAKTRTLANNLTTSLGHGSMTLLQSAGSGSSTANIAFDNLDVTTYSAFLLEWMSHPQGDDKHLYFQMRDSSGNNITTSQYNSAGLGISSSSFTGNYSWHENNQDHFLIHKNAGNDTGEAHNSIIRFTPRKSTHENRHGNFVTCQGLRYDASSNYRSEFSCGSFNDGSPPEPHGFRIYYQTNNIDNYDYKLYGIVE